MSGNQKTEAYTRLLNAGLDLFRKKGFANTSLLEIIKKARSSKGGFYHYFTDKDDFAIQVIGAHTKAILEQMEEAVGKANGSSLKKIKAAVQNRIEYFDSINYRRGSLLMGLLTEFSDRPSLVLKTVNESYNQIYNVIATHFAKAQEEGDINRLYTPIELAVFMYSGFEGALIAARAEKSRHPLDIYQKLQFAFWDTLKDRDKITPPQPRTQTKKKPPRKNAVL